MAAYKNPWHKPGGPYGPPIYETEVTPTAYRGFLIYERIAGACWDVVKHGVCITQRAGPNGARSAVDELLEQAAKRTRKRRKAVSGSR